MTIFSNKVPEQDKVDFSSKTQAASYVLEKICQPLSSEMTEEEKTKYNDNIDRKLKSGKKLTKKEEQYLKETNPQMYMQYLRIRQRAESLKSQLKCAKTKEQANRIIMSAEAGISDKDPCKEYVQAALHKVADDYRSSRAYQKLPNTDAMLAKKKQASSGDDSYVVKDDEEENESDFDPMSWSPLQEVVDAMPRFDAPA